MYKLSSDIAKLIYKNNITSGAFIPAIYILSERRLDGKKNSARRMTGVD